MVSPMGVQAGAVGGRTDRRQVHGGGEILAADVAERIRAHRVAREGPEGAVGVGGAVEVRRFGGVVHEDHQPAGQVARGVDEPAVQGEADLRDLAVSQDDTLRCETLRDGRRAGFGLEPGEVARSVDAHQELAQAAVPAHDPVDRERVEDLVRDDGTDRRRASSSSPASARVSASPSAARRSRRVSSTRRLHLDGVVRDGREQGRPRVPESPEEPGRQRSRSGTWFRDGERGGAAQRVPRLLQQPADRGPEDRVGLGGREEVGACRPGSSLRAPVVPVAGLVERELHEPGEGDGSVPLDLLRGCVRRARRPRRRTPGPAAPRGGSRAPSS